MIRPGILLLIFLIIVLEASIIEAAFKVYLSGGRVITGVGEIAEGDENVTMLKGGITLEVRKSSVIKIEEYIPAETDEPAETSNSMKADAGETVTPLVYEGDAPRSGQEEEIEKEELRIRYESAVLKLERIQELEKMSEELEAEIYRSLRLLSPRKARKYRKEKSVVDRELEQLRGEEEALRKEKRRLEKMLGISDAGGQEMKAEEEYGESETDDVRELSEYDMETIESGILFRERSRRDFQREELQKRDQAGELPEQFRPYKDFLDKQHQQLHNE